MPSSLPTRREFVLGTLGGAAFGVAACGTSGGTSAANSPGVASIQQGEPAASSGGARPAKSGRGGPLGVALVGLGEYSQTQLAPALKLTRHCALRGIVTGSPEKARRWQNEHAIPDRNVYDYASLPKIANDPDIDVVYVVVPTGLHAKYAIMAAEAGKHVWCEKPMAMTVEECRKMIDVCRSNRVSLAIGYRMRHEPNTQTVMRFARERPYGDIQRLRAVAGDRSGGEPTWRMVRNMGGGALYDMGVYSVNGIRGASGDEPVRVVKARQWADRPDLFREVDENTEFELELRSGATGYGKASRSSNENVLRVEAARGWYELQPMQAYEGVQGTTSDGKRLDQKVDKQQARQMDDDARAILEGLPLVAPGEEGLRDIRIIQAILECASTGKPVSLEG